MKLKHVVALMGVMGLVSTTAFAADTDTSTAATDTTTTTTTTTDSSATSNTADTSATTDKAPAKKHHKRHHHKVYAEAPTTYKDYKDALPIVIERIDNSQAIYDAMSQNLNRGRPMPDWFNRLGFNGGVNFDAFWGNRGMGYMTEDINRIALNDAYLNTTAVVNDWARGFLSLSYNNTSDVLATAPKTGRYSNVYPINTVNLEQGYITIADYDVSPVFVQIGKQFSDFGRYTIHPLERTLAQSMTESLQTSAKLGFITRNGLHGQMYAFNNSMTQFSMGHPKTVYGAALGFDQLSDVLGFDVGVGYMSQLVGANDVQWGVGTFNGTIAAVAGSTGTGGSYVHTVGGVSAYADVNYGPFTLGGRYVTAIQNYSTTDLTTQYHAMGAGAKPWAADVTAGFGFNGYGKNQNVYVGYQVSKDSVNLYLPKNRWIIGYGVAMWKNTDLGLLVGHDTDYSTGGNGGTGKSSNTIGVRGAIKFG
jgi:hypothetical protein